MMWYVKIEDSEDIRVINGCHYFEDFEDCHSRDRLLARCLTVESRDAVVRLFTSPTKGR